MMIKTASTSERQPVEKRLFFVSLILTAGLMGIYEIYGLIIGYEWPVLVIYGSGFVIYSTMLTLFLRGFSFRVLSLTYYYLIIGLVTVAWLPSGGLQGAIIRFVVLIFMSGLMVLDLSDFLGFCIALLLVVGGFSYLEYAGLVAPAEYTDRSMLLSDLMITNVTMLAVVGIALFYFKKAYLEDRCGLKQANLDLEKEKVRAQAADKAKTEFLATISHEMRTPLNGIVGITDLLNETHLQENQQELVNKLAFSSNLLNNLISDVLDLSLIESGKLAFKAEPVDLQNELNDIISLVAPRLANKKENVAFRWKMNVQTQKHLVTDVKRFRQVLINLLVNAIKYTEEGSVTLTVDEAGSEADKVILKFTIDDTGIGIPLERQEMLFSKFYKAHEHSTIEGTGLGLSIAKSLVDRMGGIIGFRSTPGVGSVFYFSIPFKIAHEMPSMMSQTIETPVKDYSKLRVLIAEDQEINVMVIEKMLENIGVVEIDYARDGEEVLEKVREKIFDVILMDVQMPNKDGIEAARELSTDFDNVPVIIALTANVLKEDIDACLNAGMQDFISKPFKKEQLISVFDKHLA